MKKFILIVVTCTLAFTVLADTKSPYAGEESRKIKALSGQEVEGYLTGKGLGYAKAAELNQHPGPRHVLDLAKELALTGEQITQTQAVFDAMEMQAIRLGKQLVAKEQELDRGFASGTIDPTSLMTLVLEIGTLQAQLRYVHLNAHLEQKALLSKQQIENYDRLRGYGISHSSERKHSH